MDVAIRNQDERLKTQIESWRKSLINLTRSNRLLYFKPGSVLEIVEPDPLHVYSRLEAGLEVVVPLDPGLFPDQPPQPLKVGQVRFGPLARSTTTAKLKSLERAATQTFLDRGIWTLYLGFGLLEWEDSPQSAGTVEKDYSPMLLVPVTVRRDSTSDPFKIRLADEEQRFNPALLAKLEDDFGITLQLPADDDELEPRQVFECVAAQVAGKGWHVHAKTLLSTFTFQKEPILRDLKTNESTVLLNELVRGLAVGSDAGSSFEFDPVGEEDIDRAAPPEKVVTILDADSSQRKAIAAALAGQSFVMDGPPGTGKSQTIANMIAELLARRKSILFVSDKAAALDVVHTRLEAAGLSEFVLELHSHKATRKEVAKQLGKSLRQRVRADASMPEAEREQLRRKREQLSDYVVALNVARPPLGLSLHQVVGRIAGLQGLPQAPPPSLGVMDLGHQRWAEVLELADSLGRAWGPIARGDEFLWRDLIPTEWGATQRVRLQSVLESARGRLSELDAASKDIAVRLGLQPPATTAHAEQCRSMEKLLQRRSYVHGPWLRVSGDGKLRTRLEEGRQRSAELAKMEACLVHDVGPRWQELPIDGAALLSKRVAAASSTLPRPTINVDTTSEVLEADRGILMQATSLLKSCDDYARIVADAFNQRAGGISFNRAMELARLAQLAEETNLPEADWLAPAGLRKAREAIHRLHPHLEKVRALEASLKGIFTRDVLALDLETLCVRFQSTYRGALRWFNTDYRKDRRALRSVSRSGRLRREELARLADALEWQRAAGVVNSLEQDLAKPLGHFFRGEETDLVAANRGADVAQSACELAGMSVRPDSLAKRIAFGADPGPEIAQAAQAILDLDSRWESLGSVAAQLRNSALPKAIEGVRQADAAMQQVLDVLRQVEGIAGQPARLEDCVRWLELRQRIEQHERFFHEHAAQGLNDFGLGWCGRTTDWSLLEAGLDWAGEAKSALDGPVSADTAERLTTMPIPTPFFAPILELWLLSIREVAAQFMEPRATDMGRQLRGRFDEVDLLLSVLTDTMDDVTEWHAHERAIAGLGGKGLKEAIQFCLTKRVPAESVQGIIERALCEAWTDDVLKKDDRLATTRAEDRDALVRDFRRLDRELIRLAGREAIATCNQMRPTSQQGAAGIILNESEKQKRHMPIRDLLGKTREVAQAIKPCFMMSPLSVSQFLPSDMTFDVVIFDEASQVRPADAITSIYRARQLVVAGDQKQLPPTSFFERMDDGEDDTWDESEPDQYESLLDKCKGTGVFTSLPLRWHYRSQHEHLIAYSNQGFYDGKLITFPGAHADAPDLGVEAIPCPQGVYRRGGQRDNPREAMLIGERVLFHARNHPDLSIGVIAFSESQATAIDAVIERLVDEHPEVAALCGEDRLSGLFVKNLETVQGDERDVIVFSMGYGRDEAGKFTMNFGPLSKSGGERRLNVAITRARRKVEFVSSVRSSDFSADLGTEGARHLRRYLEFAERGADRMTVLAIPLEPSGGDFESPFEAEVARTIRSWGYDVVPQVGCSDYRIDLGVRWPGGQGGFALGVECDGAMYHSSRAARDRDRLRQEVLERLGWKLHRVWGPAWYRHRSEQEQRLRRAIEEAIKDVARQRLQSPIIKPVDSTAIRVEPRELDSHPTWATPYAASHLKDVPWDLEITDERAHGVLKQLISDIVGIEGPVHLSRILRRIIGAFRKERAGARIQSAVEGAILAVSASNPKLRSSDDFFWIDGDPVRVRFPILGNPLTQRTIEQISPIELERAVESTVQDALRIRREDVIQFLARHYGWERAGWKIEAAFNQSISSLVTDSRIVEDEGWLLPQR